MNLKFLFPLFLPLALSGCATGYSDPAYGSGYYPGGPYYGGPVYQEGYRPYYRPSYNYPDYPNYPDSRRYYNNQPQYGNNSRYRYGNPPRNPAPNRPAPTTPPPSSPSQPSPSTPRNPYAKYNPRNQLQGQPPNQNAPSTFKYDSSGKPREKSPAQTKYEEQSTPPPRPQGTVPATPPGVKTTPPNFGTPPR